MTGNASKRPLPPNKPAAEPELPEPDPLPECPKWLSRDAKDYWQKIVPILAPRLKLNSLDWPMLAQLCQAWAEVQEATRVVEKEGRFYKTPNGAKAVHPALKMQRSAMSLFHKYAELYGLTPKTRSRLEHLVDLEPKKTIATANDDDFDEYLKNG